MICQRCAKDKPDIHTCTPSDYVRKLEAERDALKVDAERYRWLRERHWSDPELCVVKNPSEAVKLGHDCPSRSRLDEKIDAAMKEEKS